MKIPKVVKVAGHSYSVRYPYNCRGFKWAAEADHDLDRIRLASTNSKGRRKCRAEIEETFLHEIVHAVNCRYLPRRSQLCEHQVSQMSQGLYQVLRDNRLRF